MKFKRFTALLTSLTLSTCQL